MNLRPPYLQHATMPVPPDLAAEYSAWRPYPTLKLSAPAADGLIRAFIENQAIPDDIIKEKAPRFNPKLAGNLLSHGTRTAVLALLTNEELARRGMEHMEDRLVLANGAFLHDIAKAAKYIYEVISVQGKIPHNSREWEIIKQHPALGKIIVDAVYRVHRERVTTMTREQIAQVGEAVFHHHERMDGGGYYAVRAESIPLSSRIIAVADACDVMRSGNNGGRAWREPERRTNAVIAELRRSAGLAWDKNMTAKKESERQFDPAVVEAFEALQPADSKKKRHYIRYIRATGTDAV